MQKAGPAGGVEEEGDTPVLDYPDPHSVERYGSILVSPVTYGGYLERGGRQGSRACGRVCMGGREYSVLTLLALSHIYIGSEVYRRSLDASVIIVRLHSEHDPVRRRSSAGYRHLRPADG
ncbi:hypothetical protein NPX13_g10375 [Xylaria arbuscula]|uniref:Uncharacterized protein n=1 Tax=Xylaria arbuscula TaxID=114810 RepID=A0A9W8N4P5_9PEZI|nr:hypothetical protein NPX13_g10375 [Xylaria arbuscula]